MSNYTLHDHTTTNTTVYVTHSLVLAGIILMNLKYSAEREAVSRLLAPQIVDPENASSHLLPYVAYESCAMRERIIETVLARGE